MVKLVGKMRYIKLLDYYSYYLQISSWGLVYSNFGNISY